MKVALYARVSTDDQDPAMQLKDLREYCATRGFEIYQEYVDVGVSGSKRSRPQLDALMADAAKRRFKTVLCWRFDRFARSTKHLVEALSEFRSKNIEFISFNENIDTSSPIGEAIFTIIGAMAQLERDIIRERVRGGLRNAKAKGKKLGRPKALSIATVFKIRSERARGISIRKIAQEFGLSKSSVERALRLEHVS